MAGGIPTACVVAWEEQGGENLSGKMLLSLWTPLGVDACSAEKKKKTNTATSPRIQRVSWVCLQQAPSGWGQYGQHHPFTQILPSAKAAKGSPTWERGNCSVKEIPPGVSPAGAPMLSGGAGHLAVLEERAARAAGC